MYWTVIFGSKLEIGRNVVVANSQNSPWWDFVNSLIQNLASPLALLLAQIVTIILVARILGMLFKKIGQPSVIGEIIAGILLGPSFIGHFFPGFSAVLFPVQSLGNLHILSQIGLIMFMFIVGMELDLKVLRNRANDAVVVSHASIIMPFALGMGLAYFVYESFAPQGVQFLSFALFLGIAISITAFPVLARIVQERGIHKTRLGTVVITCAAIDDITAWSLLAVVIAIVKAGSFVSSLYTILLAAIYVVLMIKVVRPFLKRVGDLQMSREKLSKPIVAIFFITLIISAYATELIGIHALFGAFMAGAIMPDNVKFRNIFIEKMEDVALVLLLPLFFVFTGLRTQIGLLNDPYLWQITALIIAVAVTGKFVGGALAAKFVGQNWKDSLTIGALMNTRGLMELIVLNIGYDLGVLTPEIFAMMVIMALVTTFMTGPSLSFINWAFKVKTKKLQKEFSQIGAFKILISFGHPERGRTMLRLANGMVKKLDENSSVTALNLSPSNELNQYNEDEYKKGTFAPILDEAEILNQKLIPIFKVSHNIETDIAEYANKGEFDMLLIGIGQSIFEGTLLGNILGFTTKIINPDTIINQLTGKENLFDYSPFDERTRSILTKCNISMGILVDKGLNEINTIFIPMYDEKDLFLIKYAQKFINNLGAQVTILNLSKKSKNHVKLEEAIEDIQQVSPEHISILTEDLIDNAFVGKQQLFIISINSWKMLINENNSWLSEIPSTLIISEKSKK
jgi:Kef-type K+ transport system membrane component KefB